MFYSGATFVTRGNAFRFYDWDHAKDAVDAFMGTYDVHTPAGVHHAGHST
jgi:4-hydroxyphenylacetate 3-monooxygenase